MSALVLPLWALAATLFSAVALARLLKTPPAPAPAPAPPLLLLRPLDAPTPAELRALATPVHYAGALEQVVLSPTRPPLPEGVRWLRSDPATPNRKVGHLLHGLACVPTRGRVVLSIDADVAVTGALLQALALPVASGSASACSAAWRPVGGAGVAALALHGLLRGTHHSFLALAAMSAGAPTLSGKALALSPQALALLPALAEHVGEDLELARQLHAAGARTALAAVPALVPLAQPLGTGETLARITRWLQVLGSHRPALYPTVPLLFAPTLPLLLALTLWPSRPLALLLLALGVVRTLLCARLGALSRVEGEPPQRGRAALGWLAGEALLLAAFARSLLRPARVSWRGRRYALGAGGRMRPLDAEAPGAGAVGGAR